MDLNKVEDRLFSAPAAPEKSGRMYGGQFLAQAIGAACASTDPDRDIHSLHGYFLKAGDVDHPVDLHVEKVRDGRSFSSRVVRALQSGKELFRMMASFHVPEEGDVYSGARMPEVPPPEEVPLTYNAYSRQVGEADDWDGEARPMDLRYINPPSSPPGQAIVEPQLVWVRINEALDDLWPIHFAGLAYLSDSTLVDHVVLPHGRRWQDPALNGASLDHAMWFHHRARADEWLLFDQQVLETGHGRGLAQGRLFDRSGRLVANCVQEGMIRWS
jgi:acyl-CoA thioesterase-2